MATLLEKTRKINKLLQRYENVEYDSVAKVLSNVLDANVYIMDKTGEICGYAFTDNFECELMIEKVIRKGRFPKPYVRWLNRLEDTQANRRTRSGTCAYDEHSRCSFESKNTTIVPIYGVGRRIGTLIMARYDEDFTEDDLLLAEYGATVVGMEMLGAKKSYGTNCVGDVELFGVGGGDKYFGRIGRTRRTFGSVEDCRPCRDYSFSYSKCSS